MLKTKYRTVVLAGHTAVELLDGPFAGVVYVYGKIVPIELENELKLQFEYQIILDEYKHLEGTQGFLDEAFNVLLDIIEKDNVKAAENVEE